MNLKKVIFGFLVIFVLLFSCCLENQKEKQAVCETPYTIINNRCCLDLNENKLCDEIEVTTTITSTTTITTTIITTPITTQQQTTTTTIKIACYKSIDCGNVSYSEPFCYKDLSIDKIYSSKNFIVPLCINPGNESAECVYRSNKIDEWLCKEKCVNGTCVGDQTYLL